MTEQTADKPYDCILVETVGTGPRKTGLIRLNRPKALNALSDPLMDELGEALYAFDADDGICASASRCWVPSAAFAWVAAASWP